MSVPRVNRRLAPPGPRRKTGQLPATLLNRAEPRKSPLGAAGETQVELLEAGCSQAFVSPMGGDERRPVMPVPGLKTRQERPHPALHQQESREQRVLVAYSSTTAVQTSSSQLLGVCSSRYDEARRLRQRRSVVQFVYHRLISERAWTVSDRLRAAARVKTSSISSSSSPSISTLSPPPPPQTVTKGEKTLTPLPSDSDTGLLELGLGPDRRL